MTTGEREPFAPSVGPFVQSYDVGVITADDIVSSVGTTVPCDATPSEVVPAECTDGESVVSNDDTTVADEVGPMFDNAHSVPIVASVRHGANRRVRIRIPASVDMRFRAIVSAERRTLPVVMTKTVEDFLDDAMNEPRPYIPLELNGDRDIVFSVALNRVLVERVEARALSESRDMSTVMLRAILDYIAGSPDDPMREVSE